MAYYTDKKTITTADNK